MNVRNYMFVSLMLIPSILAFILNVMGRTNSTAALASMNDIFSITFFPFVVGLFFKNKTSYVLAASLPTLLILTKSVFFTGEERVVAVGLFVFLGISLVSCTLAVIVKAVFHKYSAWHSSKGARNHSTR